MLARTMKHVWGAVEKPFSPARAIIPLTYQTPYLAGAI